MLGAVLDLPERRSTVFTGQVSLAAHPWLADHTIQGTALLPATAVVDLALHVGAELGCPFVDELTLHSPLALPDDTPRDLRLTAAKPEQGETVELTLHSREFERGEWTHHATAALTTHPPAATPSVSPSATWPPAGADAVDLASTYDELAGRGYQYGPLFQGLTAAWRDGDDVYAEVALPSGTGTEGYGVHPALLDAALHPLALHPDETTTTRTALPYAFQGISLHSTRAEALRVRLTKTGPHTLALVATDAAGAPVAAVDALTLRSQSTSAHAPLHHVHWTPQPLPPTAVETTEPIELSLPEALAALTGPTGATGLGSPDRPTPVPRHLIVHLTRPDTGPSTSTDHDTVTHTLAFLQAWLTGERAAGTHLTLTTHNATPVASHSGIEPAHAALWGLIRTAQTEHPHRITLIDLDTHPDTATTLPHALQLRASEPQLAIRHGEIHTPRLARLPAPASTSALAGAKPWNPEGTVLITGGTGTLGAHTARHLVRRHGIRHLLLVSRSGMDAPGAEGLRAELRALGADVTVSACDISDREAVDTALRGIPARHPLSAVVHTAGIIEDATVTALTPGQLLTTWRPKAHAAWHLHEATRHLDLDAFVLYSSLAATVGSPGQANYAAANAYLDALAGHRHQLGLPATSLAWGPWADGGMAGRLSEADAARVTRTGFPAMAAQRALALLDAALAVPDRPVLVATALDPAALRAQAESGSLPPLFEALAPRRAARGAAAGTPGAAGVKPAAAVNGASAAETLQGKLAGLPPTDRREHLLGLVRSTTASILAYSDLSDVPARSGFLDMGIDSLSTIELRNTLASLTGLQLSATLVFDHPTPAALADHLDARLSAGSDRPGRSERPDVIGDTSSSASTAPSSSKNRDRNRNNQVPDALLSASAEEVLQFIDREFSDSLHVSDEAAPHDE
ncbi:type I polyketide synthase [Streptomyces sp. NPDC018587]|uniref:type I polyketide synthase n=1 Tax=Streptomyces sp. NPDC018587 TaxID=3365048 RepID=UPI0037BB0AAF